MEHRLPTDDTSPEERARLRDRAAARLRSISRGVAVSAVALTGIVAALAAQSTHSAATPAQAPTPTATASAESDDSVGTPTAPPSTSTQQPVAASGGS